MALRPSQPRVALHNLTTVLDTAAGSAFFTTILRSLPSSTLRFFPKDFSRYSSSNLNQLTVAAATNVREQNAAAAGALRKSFPLTDYVKEIPCPDFPSAVSTHAGCAVRRPTEPDPTSSKLAHKCQRGLVKLYSEKFHKKDNWRSCYSLQHLCTGFYDNEKGRPARGQRQQHKQQQERQKETLSYYQLQIHRKHPHGEFPYQLRSQMQVFTFTSTSICQIASCNLL